MTAARAATPRPRTGTALGTLVCAGLVAVSVTAIARVQPPLAEGLHSVKLRDDVYVLPPPHELRTLSLGYHAAVADALWARLLVDYGTHWQEKREFLQGPNYFDGILELEPDFPLVFKFADTILCYRPLLGTADDARKAREYFERGVKARPSDYNVWLQYGQFLAFLAPGFLTDENEKEQWRKDGAEKIVHAVQLGAAADRSLAASGLLGRAGEKEAAIRNLRRSYALTDDPNTRAQILGHLQKLGAGLDDDGSRAAIDFVESTWMTHFAFIPRTTYLLLGPMHDPAACAGLASDCPRDWSDAIPRPEAAPK
jgi:hypothetical protein